MMRYSVERVTPAKMGKRTASEVDNVSSGDEFEDSSSDASPLSDSSVVPWDLLRVGAFAFMGLLSEAWAAVNIGNTEDASKSRYVGVIVRIAAAWYLTASHDGPTGTVEFIFGDTYLDGEWLACSVIERNSVHVLGASA